MDRGLGDGVWAAAGSGDAAIRGGHGSSFDLSVFDGPQEFHTTPTLSHEEIMSLTTVTDTAGLLQLFPQQSYSDDQLTPEQLKHWQTFAEFVEFDLNRKEREAAEDAAQVAKGQAILVGLFTAMWEPADWRAPRNLVHVV